MGRVHSGYDVYLGEPDADQSTHSLRFTSALISEDHHGHVIKIRGKADKGGWTTLYQLVDTGPLQRNGTAMRWTGTGPTGERVTLSAIRNSGGCVPCGRR